MGFKPAVLFCDRCGTEERIVHHDRSVPDSDVWVLVRRSKAYSKESTFCSVACLKIFMDLCPEEL